MLGKGDSGHFGPWDCDGFSLSGMAALVGLVVAVPLVWWLSTHPELISEPTDEPDHPVRILAAKTPIAPGEQITKDRLVWIELSREALPEGALTEVDALRAQENAPPPLARVAIAKGEPIVASALAWGGPRSPGTPALAEGMRAVRIMTNPVHFVAGFLAPGDQVDIALLREVVERRVSHLMMENIRVLEVEYPTSPAEMFLTVELSPRQVQLIAPAQKIGRLSVIVRAGAAPAAPAPFAVPVTDPRWLSPAEPVVPIRIRDGVIDDQPVHPILIPPDDAIEDPAQDWVPGDTWPPRLPGGR